MHTEEAVWNTARQGDLWVLDKLLLSKHLGYICGPTGVAVPKPDWYIVRPCVNAMGLGLGAKKIWLEGNTDDLPLGHFWCEWFEGDHYSVDFVGMRPILTVQGIKTNSEILSDWDKWVKVEHNFDLKLPIELSPTWFHYPTVNAEYIGNKLIEVHFRPNPDFPEGRSEYIPVWPGQQHNPPSGYTYIEDPECHGRIGAFVK